MKLNEVHIFKQHNYLDLVTISGNCWVNTNTVLQGETTVLKVSKKLKYFNKEKLLRFGLQSKVVFGQTWILCSKGKQQYLKFNKKLK